MSILNEFARMVGVEPRLAEDALHSERCAKAVLSRRALFGGAAVLASGIAFGFAPEPAEPDVKYINAFSAYPALMPFMLCMPSLIAVYYGGRADAS